MMVPVTTQQLDIGSRDLPCFQGAEWANPPGSECGHTSGDACATCVAKNPMFDHQSSSGVPRNDDVKCNYLGMTMIIPNII